jgi:hypothetical protein
LPIRRKLDVGDLAGYHHFLAIVLLRVREELGDFQKTGCVRKQRYQAEGEKGEKKNQDACDSVMLKRWLDVRRSGHDVDVLYLTQARRGKKF